MIPSHLPQSIGSARCRTTMSLSSSISTASFRNTLALTRQQSRTFWGWRRCAEELSHLDPMYRRLAHHRTLKTRARLLEKIRRRGKWDWDVSQKPFFTPKHIRLASYWNGIGRPRATSREISEDDARSSEADLKISASTEEQQWPEDDVGHELSRREKEWKEQMAAMRRRIEQDPYAAVFGRRFQPFWDPISNWMQNGVSNGSASRTGSSKKASQMVSDRSERGGETQQSSTVPSKSRGLDNGRKDLEVDVADTPEGQLTDYSYSSSTSWDSVTNKARRQEWDSITNQTRHYEYDPISNRMVKVEQRRQKETKSIPTESSSTTPVSLTSSPLVTSHESVQIPLKNYSEVRQAIPVPTQNSDSKTSVYFPSLLNSAPTTSPAPAPSRASTAEKTEPPISREFEQDLDTLTADDVRASMGSKPGKQRRQSGLDVMLNTLGAEHTRPQVKSQWDQAEDQVMLERELEKLRIAVFNQSSDAQDAEQGKAKAAVRKTSPLQSSVDRLRTKKDRTETSQHNDSLVGGSLESNSEADSESIPKNWAQQAELLQADRVDRTSDNLGLKPRLQLPHWMRNANLNKVDALLQEEMDLQKRHLDSNEDRYARKISDLRTELDAAYKQSSVQAQMQVERIHALEAELQHARKDAVVRGDGDATAAMRWKSESEKYQQKIAALRKELDTSFKQSSIASEMHLDRIRQLENDLKCAQETLASDRRQLEDLQQGGLKPEQVMEGIREAVSNIFSKNTAAFDAQTERVKGLADRLQQMHDNLEAAPKSRARKGATQAMPASPELQRAEGDFCANITKFAGEDNRWYKRPAVKSKAPRDRSLEQEVQAIYEEHYGPIDVQHRQSSAGQRRFDNDADAKAATPVIEIESPVDLGDALAAYEQKQSYSFARDNLSTEIAREEKEAHEKLNPTESSSNVWFEDRLYGQVPAPHKVNPIDGTGSAESSRYSYAPDTGSFASPTGFVGDRIWDDSSTTPVPDGQQTDYTRQVESSGSAPSNSTSSTIAKAKEQQLLRVRREERVFTGTLNPNPDSAASDAAPQGYSRHHGRRHDGSAQFRRGRRESLLGGMSYQQQQRRRRVRRRAIRWVLGLGLSATALAYGIGTLAERQEQREMEAWERMLQAAERVDANRGGKGH